MNPKRIQKPSTSRCRRNIETVELPDEMSEITILPDLSEIINKAREKEILRKFGIIQSSSTSIDEIDFNRNRGSKREKKRRISFSTSWKNVKKAKNISKYRKPKNEKRLSLQDNPRHSGTYIVEHVPTEDDSLGGITLQPSIIPLTLDVVSDSLLQPDVDDFDANIEHNTIATKYGLPYEIIQCTCFLRDEISEAYKESYRPDTSVCVTQSCYDFERVYGRYTEEASKDFEDAKSSKDFEDACETYIQITRKHTDAMDEGQFLSAKCYLEILYPYYWNHIDSRYVHFLSEHDVAKEKYSKTQMIVSCKRMLREQAHLSKHYRVQMTGLADGLEFGERLSKNFEIACTFFKTEYPGIFVYLFKKYKFNDLLFKKMKVIRNRLKIIKKSRKSEKQLKESNEKYMNTEKKG